MNLEFSAPTLTELESLLTNLLSKGNCFCHFINPNKTRILLWRRDKDGQTTYYLKIGIQKFVSQEQFDRNGETYWRFKDEAKKEEPTNLETTIPFKKNAELDAQSNTNSPAV